MKGVIKENYKTKKLEIKKQKINLMKKKKY